MINNKLKIKHRLEENGITMTSIGEILNKSHGHVSQVVSGKIATSPEIQNYISNVLEESVEDLFPLAKKRKEGKEGKCIDVIDHIFKK